MTDSGKAQSGSGDGTRLMVAGSVTAAGAAYLFLQGGARLLGAERFAAISALWTIQFLIMAVALLPLEQLTIRTRALQSGTQFRRATGVVVTLAAIGAGVYAGTNLDALFSGESVFIPLSVLSVITMGVFAIGRGELAGRLRYRDYGLVTGGQAVLRLVAGLGLIAATDSAAGGGWAMVLSPLLVLGWWRFRAPGPEPTQPKGAGSFLTGVLVANAAAQTILVAGPLAVERLGGSAAEVSILFVTLTLFRAPLAVANNLLARLLPPFSSLAAGEGVRVLRRWAIWLPAAGAVAGAVAVAAGAWLGPAITSGLFGSEFRPTATAAALVAGGSVLATVAAFANQILLAMGATWRLATAWLFGLAVAVTIMALVTSDPGTRVASGFLAGESAALIAVGTAALTSRMRVTGPGQTVTG
jgi:O-antigen/teichoic acid export membrane protein